MMLARWQSSFVDAQGNVLPNAQVTVRRESDQAIVGIFSDSDGNTPKTNPFNADSSGYGFFYVNPGLYRITATLGGDAVDWRDIRIIGEIVGTVSQSGGEPTGAIIERGSNANGTYVKFADGTLICRISKIRMVPITPDGVAVTWNYPAAFVGGAPVTVHTPDQGLQADTPNVPPLKKGAALTSAQVLSSVSLRTGAISGTYASGDFVDTSAVAHGRWY